MLCTRGRHGVGTPRVDIIDTPRYRPMVPWAFLVTLRYLPLRRRLCETRHGVEKRKTGWTGEAVVACFCRGVVGV